MADVKLETDIVEKRLFAVKKKITYYTLSTFPKYLVSQQFMLCKFLGCCLKRGFKYNTLLDACYLTRRLLF